MSCRDDHLLAELYRAFWGSLYGYLRSAGYAHYDAEDLIQGLFVRLMERRVFHDAGCPAAQCRTCQHPRCYAFLLGCLKHYLCNECDRAHSVRRGGRFTFVPWEDDSTSDAMRREGPCPSTPVDLLEARWAATVLERAVARLRAQLNGSCPSPLFESLERYLTGDTPHGIYSELAATWGLSEPTVRMILCRLRRKLGQTLRTELAHDGRPVAWCNQTKHYFISWSAGSSSHTPGRVYAQSPPPASSQAAVPLPARRDRVPVGPE